MKETQNQNLGFNRKIFNDCIHGHIEFHPLLVRIIDTVQFQRLREIKQLSTAHYVYAGACHSRFEHSLGVAYLAGQLVRQLREKQPELEISERDVLCVEMAGLCHDLGHGPFSHLFESIIRKLRPDCRWKHEHNSVRMLEHLITKNGLIDEFHEKYGLSQRDIDFVKSLIDTDRPRESGEKSFLYEIVANKRTGIDVDKWDYFARDCQYLGIRSMFDHNRYIKFARVIRGDDGCLHIGTRDKESSMVYEIFIHHQAYHHPVATSIGLMITDAIVKANPYLCFNVNGKPKTIADSIDDMDVFELLTDNLQYLIRLSSDSRLHDSQQLFRRINERRLYRLIAVATKVPDDSGEIDDRPVDFDDPMVCIETNEYKYGVNGSDPGASMCFYDKRTMKQTWVDQMLMTVVPSSFRERQLSVFHRTSSSDDSQDLALVIDRFKRFCQANNYRITTTLPLPN